MAYVFSFFGFDQSKLDLSQLYYNATGSNFYDNANINLNGVTYNDVVEVLWASGGTAYASVFGGTDIVVNGFDQVVAGTTTGYIEFYWTGSSYSPTWGVQNISLPATGLYQAATTLSPADDYSLINDALRGNDVFDLSNGSDFAYALGGNDRMFGYRGNDTLLGGNGNDRLVGGADNDAIVGQRGSDVLLGQAGHDVLLGHAADDHLRGQKGQDKLTGGKGEDTLKGNAGQDELIGGPGKDKLNGGKNDDVLKGGGKRDFLNGGNGNDELRGASGSDVLRGRGGDDKLIGGPQDDRLFGNNGDDTLLGKDGSDTLIGGPGSDALFGKAGPDSFQFKAAAHSKPGAKNRDKIKDFSDDDLVDLSAIDSKTGGGNQPFDFIGDAAFSGAKGELRYDKMAHKTTIQADRNGDGVSDFEFQLDDAMNLQADDFIL